MSGLNLGKMIGFKPSISYPYYNTRTPIDIGTGEFVRGSHGEWLLNGGIGPVNGLAGRSGYYKSTTVDKIVTDLLEIYPDTEFFKMDTENTSTSIERFVRLANGSGVDVESRVHLTNKGELNLQGFCDMITNIGETKLAHSGDYTIELPFLNRNTDKPLKILLPTFISLDSISNLSTDTNVSAIESGIESKKNNTSDMYDGRIKKRLLDLFVTWAYKYSICFFVTAHIGEKQELDPYHPSPKQNQWMNYQEKITNAGKNFLYLPNLSFQLIQLKPLVDDSKNPLYPSSANFSEREKVEINKVDLKVLRGKNNITGTVIPLVTSQHFGILGDLSFYEYLRKIDGQLKSGEVGISGFIAKGVNRYSPLMPDTCLTRKNIRQVCASDYRVRRSLEIMYQLVWMNRYWNLTAYPFNIPATLEQLVNDINGSGKIAIDDILESRGYWTYDKSNKRKYMSILDICEIVGAKDRPMSAQVPDDLAEAQANLANL